MTAIKKAIENNDSTLSNISPDKIANLEQQLYTLPLNGETLKNIKVQAERGQDNAFKYEENHYKPTRKTRSRNIFLKLYSLIKYPFPW